MTMKLTDRLSRIEALLEMNIKATERLANALDGHDGLIVRVDRVEGVCKTLRKWTGLVGATAVAALVTKLLPNLHRIL